MEKYCTARQVTWQYGASALHAGQLRLQTLTQNMSVQYALLLHGENGCTNAPHCYIKYTFPVLFDTADIWRFEHYVKWRRVFGYLPTFWRIVVPLSSVSSNPRSVLILKRRTGLFLGCTLDWITMTTRLRRAPKLHKHILEKHPRSQCFNTSHTHTHT